MRPLPEKSPSHRKAALLLGLVSFFSFLYFYEGGGWNQNSRFDLLRAIVERHTLQIDVYHENTQDKAQFDGHYYSDKAPGLVFLAVPFALGARSLLRSVGIDPESPRGELALSYVVSAGAVALPTALAGVCLFFLGLRCGGGSSGAAFATLVMGLGTPIWAYASLFWAHALVGACLVFAFASALKVGDSASARCRFSLGASGRASGGMGDGYGISRGAGLGDAGISGAVAGRAARDGGAMARGGWCERRGGDLPDGVAELSACGVWGVSSKLFVLRSELVFVHAAAGVYGFDVPSPGPPAEAAVRMLAGTVPGFAGAGGSSRGAVVVVERETVSSCGDSGGSDCGVLLSVQRVVLLVEVGAVVRSALCGGKHSVVVRWSGCGVGACHAGMAPGTGWTGSVQRVRRADGGLDDVAIVHAGSLSAGAFGVAGVLVGADGAQSSVDAVDQRSGIECGVWSIQPGSVGWAAWACEFVAVDYGLGCGGVGLAADEPAGLTDLGIGCGAGVPPWAVSQILFQLLGFCFVPFPSPRLTRLRQALSEIPTFCRKGRGKNGAPKSFCPRWKRAAAARGCSPCKIIVPVLYGGTAGGAGRDGIAAEDVRGV